MPKFDTGGFYSVTCVNISWNRENNFVARFHENFFKRE